MGVKVKVRVGRKKIEIEIPGFDSIEELEAHYQEVVDTRIMATQYKDFEDWLHTVVPEGEITHKDIMEVWREEGKRGAPGGNEPTGERKDAQILAKSYKKWVRREKERGGQYNDLTK